MAAPSKPEPVAPAARPPEPDEPAPAGAEPRASAFRPWLPLLVGIIVAPALTAVVMMFVVVPQLQKRLAPAAAAGAPATIRAEPPRHEPPQPDPYYEFSNVVVNLAGTMGTRYLKTSFQVVGEAKGPDDIHRVFEENRSKLQDTTLNVLSAVTLADLEEPGAKNVIRERLVGAYNQALGRHVARQVYFSEFVVQ